MADIKKIGLFAGGVLFGSAGIKALSSKDAKKVYTQGTAAVLRVKDCLTAGRDSGYHTSYNPDHGIPGRDRGAASGAGRICG